RAEPLQVPAPDGELDRLRLREEVERPRRRPAERGDVDPREVVEREHGAALRRDPLAAVDAHPREQLHRAAHHPMPPGPVEPDPIHYVRPSLRTVRINGRLQPLAQTAVRSRTSASI